MHALRMCLEVLRMALVDLARRPAASLLSIVALSVAVFLFAAFLVVGSGLEGLFRGWSDQAAVEVYLDENANPDTVDALVAALEADPSVRRLMRVPAQRALEEFRELFPDLGDVRELLGENPFPSSLRIVPASPDPNALDAMSLMLDEHPAVEAVRYDRAWITALSRLREALSIVLIVGSGVLLLAGLTTLGAVIRLALDDKRDEVRLMRLVGAPASFVIAPVLSAGAILGALGAVIALVGVEFARHFALARSEGGSLEALVEQVLGNPLPAASITLLVLAAAAAGLVAAGPAAGRAALR